MKTSEWDWSERFPHSGLSEDYYDHPFKQTPLRANNTFFLFKKKLHILKGLNTEFYHYKIDSFSFEI